MDGVISTSESNSLFKCLYACTLLVSLKLCTSCVNTESQSKSAEHAGQPLTVIMAGGVFAWTTNRAKMVMPLRNVQNIYGATRLNGSLLVASLRLTGSHTENLYTIDLNGQSRRLIQSGKWPVFFQPSNKLFFIYAARHGVPELWSLTPGDPASLKLESRLTDKVGVPTRIWRFDYDKLVIATSTKSYYLFDFQSGALTNMSLNIDPGRIYFAANSDDIIHFDKMLNQHVRSDKNRQSSVVVPVDYRGKVISPVGHAQTLFLFDYVSKEGRDVKKMGVLSSENSTLFVPRNRMTFSEHQLVR